MNDTPVLAPEPQTCLRCARTEPMRFVGLCARCRDELIERSTREARTLEVETYQPKRNVTPNAVALKED